MNVLRAGLALKCIEIETEELTLLKQRIFVGVNATTYHTQFAVHLSAVDSFILEGMIIVFEIVVCFFTYLTKE
jgi:hypothetical protein